MNAVYISTHYDPLGFTSKISFSLFLILSGGFLQVYKDMYSNIYDRSDTNRFMHYNTGKLTNGRELFYDVM